MRVVKIIISILLLIILVVAGALACLYFFIDPNTMKPALIKEVKTQTGYDLVLDGKISWTFYPVQGIKSSHLQLKKPGDTTVFVDATDAAMEVDFSEVFSKTRTLKGKVTAAKLSLANVNMENGSADINVKNNSFSAANIKANLYDGMLDGNITIDDLRSALPKWTWNVSLTHVQLHSLLQDVQDANTKIKLSGIASFSLQSQTSGKTREIMLRQMNGNATFSVEQGSVSGMDLNYFVQLADALVNKKPTDQLVNSNQTLFKHLSGSAIITNGLANTNDLVLMAPNFITHAKGNMDLFSTNLDMELAVQPQIEGKQIDWQIPVLLKGDLHHPEVKLDMMEIQKLIAGKEINYLKQKALQQIQKHVHGEAGKVLQNLLGK